MTHPSTPLPPAPDASLGDALLNQMLAGPTSPEVATRLLRQSLRKMYPDLHLDPNSIVVGEPAWAIVDDKIVELSTRYQTLSNLLAAQLFQGEQVLLTEGFHYITQLPLVTPEKHLPVPVGQVGQLINELMPVMIPACQEQQLAYWNASLGSSHPRWHELSNTLRKLWDVRHIDGWSATECDMATRLYRHPSYQDRKDHDPYDTHAYLIDVSEVDGDKVTRLIDNLLVVLIGTIDKKEVILTHSLRNGYEKFDSQHALGQSLPSHLGSVKGSKIQWRLYEPDGNIFDQKACGLIATQIKILSAPEVLERFMSDEGDPTVNNGLHNDEGPSSAWFQSQMPDWLREASASDQVQFAQHMRNLSALSSVHAGKTYLDDIPSIKAYTLRALKQQMQSEHADAATLDPENIEIQIRSPVIWGTFVVPGKIETTRLSLVDLALQNLIALPLGDKVVRSLDGQTLPKWLDVDYVENLVDKIDIGRVYPELIKSKLLDDPAESARRQDLYISQLRIQLPMLALESKIRGKGNLDERGYRYVAALMEPDESDHKVDGQTIVLRKLAFQSSQSQDDTEDVVTNMFVIGPRDLSAGPCVLYRPLLEPQLSQYPTPSNLLYAIRQTPTLRQSVLAWLPDEVRNNYSRYIFSGSVPSPWMIMEFATDPFSALSNSAPISLSDTTLETDFLPHLFKANATALAELADRQSVSDSENRWKTFEQTGWLIFNLALPYLGASVGTAVWLWQILNDVETLTEDNEVSAREAFVDLLLNLAMAITAHAIDRARENTRRRRTTAPEVVPELEPLAKAELVIDKLTPLKSSQLPPEYYDAIHCSGALAGKAGNYTKLFETFSLDKPSSVEEVNTEGPLKGLYKQGENWYAKTAEKWFKVTVDDEHVAVVDGKDPTRVGPALVRYAGGWNLDTRLRLRGGGSKGAWKKVTEQTKRLTPHLLEELNRFEARKPQNQTLLMMDAQEMSKSSGPAREIWRQIYLSTLKTQRDRYEDALKILMQWPVFQTRPDAPQARLGYLNAQINFTFEEIDVLKERFIPALRKSLDMITVGVETLEEEHVDAADNMIQIGEHMIERLDYMETRFTDLKKLGREGYEFIRAHRAKMPAYRSDTIRLVQVEMFRHLCLSPESVNTIPEGWASINQLIDNATVALQSLQDAIDERSVIRLDEQIDALGSLTEQFTAIEEHLEYIGNEYKDNARPATLARLRKQIGQFRERTLNHLARALDERSNRRSSGSPYAERPRPRKRFIRARFWGLISGEARLTKTREETDWVDVRHPFSDKVIATFHRKETGEWVPHVNSDTPPPRAPLTIPALTVSMTKGKALIDGLPAFKAQVQVYVKQPGRTPAGIGMILNAHASRMETVGAAIDKALDSASNETVEIAEKDRRQAETLRADLKQASKALFDEGFDTVLKVIKQRPPTMSSIIWLKNRNLISIKKQNSRQRIKRQSSGYLDRYEIRDLKENKTLWFADFRYSTDWVPAHAYLSARLKTPEQVSRGPTTESTETFNRRQLIDYYRSEIAIDQAKEVFFPKRLS